MPNVKGKHKEIYKENKNLTLCKPVCKLTNNSVVSASSFLAAASISIIDLRLDEKLKKWWNILSTRW